ncbi:MAG TPA: hypothetical protein VF134_01335 [Candidatus Dormibacteraeota bacterium]
MAVALAALFAGSLAYLRPVNVRLLLERPAPARHDYEIDQLLAGVPGEAWLVVADRSGRQPGTAVLHTADGGRTWKPGGTPLVHAYTVLKELDDRTLMAQAFEFDGSGQMLLRSSNAGITWQRVKLPPGQLYPAAAYFLSRELGWYLDPDDGRLWRTADGGESWVLLPGIEGFDPPRYGMLFASPQQGWVLSGGTLLATGDGGLSWASRPLPGFGTTDVTLRLTSVGLVAVAHQRSPAPFAGLCSDTIASAQLAVSPDGGLTWLEARSLPTTLLNADSNLAFVRGGDWEVADQERIWKSSDLGRTWKPAGAPGPVVGLDFGDPYDGWASICGGTAARTLLATGDGGQHWSRVFPR